MRCVQDLICLSEHDELVVHLSRLTKPRLRGARTLEHLGSGRETGALELLQDF